VSTVQIATKVGTHSQNLANLLLAEKKLVPAQKASPNEWKRWWWICLAGQVVFGICWSSPCEDAGAPRQPSVTSRIMSATYRPNWRD
jgi:hypothetical protein